MSAPKQYGLILPGQQPKKKPLIPQRDSTARPSIFDESDDTDSGGELPPHMQQPAKKSRATHGPGLMEQRIAKQLQAKALQEDPTCFQYDELYDDMETKRDQEQQAKSQEPKKPKYISRLMEHAQRRKLENELRVERQVQKEREQEGEEFKDKESFVTSTYRKKLEEMRKLEEEEKRDEYLESIGDVTKQKDLDGFYRHLYEQKTGSTKEVQKPALPMATSAGDDEISYKPIASGGAKRAYRKRQASQDEKEEDKNVDKPTDSDTEKDTTQSEAKKIHLTNNIDADSDFSIDSSSDDSDSDHDDNAKTNSKKSKQSQSKKKNVQEDSKGIALNLPATKSERSSPPPIKGEQEKAGTEMPPPTTPPPASEEPPKPKKDKTKIWQKRTVGDVFDAAVQRYYERKASRSG